MTASGDPARDTAGVWERNRVRRAARGLTPLKMVGMRVHVKNMHGVAQSARRPDDRRMVSASDRQGVPLFRCPDTGGLKRRSAFSDTGLAFALTIRER